ncbi:MAG: 16S rRNA (guanine(966)-N(2))-methyltransferase RsmD [Muribaculaceae bacterium]|nr:16S rRNA (guanine(966)-N(2))-methyltransferase RsmD [Muribaculaceae bacterium]
MRIITGKYGRRRFQVPTNISARPTTDMARENIFNVLENWVDFEGLTALDLFSGTGAISFEFLSRGCAKVTSVEKASTQYNFIRKVKQMLNEKNLIQVKGDAFKFIETCAEQFDIIFADPPYDLPNLADLPGLILNSKMLKPGTIVIVEHSKANDFSELPHFYQKRVYGKVNFSIFRMSDEEAEISD